MGCLGLLRGCKRSRQEDWLKEQINLTLKEEAQLPLGCVLCLAWPNDYRFGSGALQERAGRTLILSFEKSVI